MYHRALRSKRSDNNYVEWNIQLQNALVRADRCLGIIWEKVIFGREYEELTLHGIDINEMPNYVFKWNLGNAYGNNADIEWKTVERKKSKKKNLKFKFTGIFI